MTCRVALLLALALPLLGRAEDWPHFLGPRYDNSSAETGLLHDWPATGPKKLWEHPKGAGHAAPAIAQGILVVFYAEGEEEVLHALDATTGADRWTYRYAAKSNAQYGSGPGPRSNPVISGNRLFALGAGATLHCLDLTTGKVTWRRDLATDYRLSPTFFGQGGTPLPLGDRLIISLGTTDGKSLVALDATSGREVWATEHPWGSSYASPIPATLHGRDCILAFQGGMEDPPTGGLLVIDAKNGRVLSATPHRASMFASVSVSSPVVAGNRVFVSEAYTEGGLCLDIAPDFTATKAWAAPRFDTYLGTAIAHDGYLYGFAGQHQQNAELACYDLSTGKERWRSDLGGKYQRGTLLRVDGSYLCLGENGDLAWLDLTPAGPVVKAQTKLFHAPESWTPPALANGLLYVCQNQPGAAKSQPRIICYDLHPGSAGGK